MEPIITRCGMRCDVCLAYRPNIEKNPANKQKLSDGWFKYFGFRIEPEDILCDGCMALDGVLLDTDCLVRPCAIERGLANCAACEDYICEKLTERLTDFDAIQETFGSEIPYEDRTLFILPYENKDRLEGLRDGLK